MAQGKKSKKALAVAEHSRSLALADEVSKHLFANKFTKKTNRDAASLIQSVFFAFIEISVDMIDGCKYNDDLGGWVQDESNLSPTLYFTVQNKSPLTYSGTVDAMIGSSSILAFGTETEIHNLAPGASASGRMWFYRQPGSSQPRNLKISFSVSRNSDGTLDINPNTGQAGRAPLPGIPIASTSYPFIAGNNSEVDAALINALGITPVYDSDGRLQSASAVDRFGIFRQIQFSTYERRKVTEPGVYGPYDTVWNFASYMTYSEQALDGRPHVYDEDQRGGIPDRHVPGRLLSVGITMDFDDTAADLMRFDCFLVGFPLGSEVKRKGDNAPSNVLGLGGHTAGHIAERGNVVVDSPLSLGGTFNNQTGQATYHFNQSDALHGVYTGFGPDVRTVFASEIRRYGYFSPLIKEEKVLLQVLGSSSSAPPPRNLSRASSVPATVASVKAKLPRNHLSRQPATIYSGGAIVGNSIDPDPDPDSILPNSNNWIAILMAANCAAALRLSCLGGPVSCGIGIMGSAICAHIVRKVNNLPVRVPARLPKPVPPSPRYTPPSGSGPDNSPISPPLENPGPPGGLGSMTCGLGYIEIGGVCVPWLSPPGGEVDFP